MMTDFIQSHNHYKMGNTKYYIYYKEVFSQGHILLSTVVGCKKKSLVPASRSKHMQFKKYQLIYLLAYVTNA